MYVLSEGELNFFNAVKFLHTKVRYGYVKSFHLKILVKISFKSKYTRFYAYFASYIVFMIL